jgi:anti-sigma28 factor (negative regulator of flagellin synthesis)
MEPHDGEAEGPPRPEPVDAEKVAALRAAVQAGELRTDSLQVAVRLLRWERLLTRS